MHTHINSSPYQPSYQLPNSQQNNTSAFNMPSNITNIPNDQQRALFSSTISPISNKTKPPGISYREKSFTNNSKMNLYKTPMNANMSALIQSGMNRGPNLSNMNANGFANNVQMLSNTNNNMMLQSKIHQNRNGNNSQMFDNSNSRSSLTYFSGNMNMSANAIGNGISGGNETPFNYANINNPRSIAVIGFPASDASSIHRKFVRYGNVFNMKHNCNVLFIEYENEMSAKRALNDNGSWITSGHQKYMIAVCFQEQTRMDHNFMQSSVNQSSFVNQNSMVSKVNQNSGNERFIGFNYGGKVEKPLFEDGGTFFTKLYDFIFTGW